MTESKAEEQNRLWLIHTSQAGDELTFPSGRKGTVTKKTDCYILIKMDEGYTNILFKDKIIFN